MKFPDGFPSPRILNLMRITITNLAPAMAALAVHHSLLFVINLARVACSTNTRVQSTTHEHEDFSRDKDVCRLRSVGCLAFHRY